MEWKTMLGFNMTLRLKVSSENGITGRAHPYLRVAVNE